MERIAFRIVSRYPEAFKENIQGMVIGNGIESLTCQLMYRSDNILRSLKDNAASLLGDETNDASQLLITEDEQEFLKTEFLLVEKDLSKVHILMKKGFSKQRKDIENKLLITEVRKE